MLDVPYEPLMPGPIGEMLEIVDPSPAGDVPHPPVDLDHPRVLMANGLEPSLTDQRFHQQMVYAVCSVTYHAFCKALGRTLTWNAWSSEGEEAGRLRVLPHAFEGRDAYYDRDTGELRFGYYLADPAPGGGTGRPRQWVFTCLSHDVIVHEITHAIIDGLHPLLIQPASAELLAFHEAFADLIAIFQRLGYAEVTRAGLARSRTLSSGAIDPATWLLDCINSPAREVGGRDTPVARFFDPLLEIRDSVAVLVAAVTEAYAEVFARKIQRYVALATGGTGVLPRGPSSEPLLEICALQASKLAVQFQAMCIRALDYCPPVDLELGDFLRAVITADSIVQPVDRWGYREAWIESFRSHGVYASGVSHLDERGLLWQSPSRPIAVRELSFAYTRFRGEPGNPTMPDESVRQAGALGHALEDPALRAELGVFGHEDGTLETPVSPPLVGPVRTAVRVGPDGQLVHERVGEVTQWRTVVRDRTAFDFAGGATVVFDADGNVKYAIRKGVGNDIRLRRQLEFAASARFFAMTGTRLLVRPQLLRRLHEHVRRDTGAESREAPDAQPGEVARRSVRPAGPRAAAPNPSTPAELFAPGHQRDAGPLRYGERPQIFVSYSHEDNKWLKRLEVTITPLTRDATLSLWSDKTIRAGDKWQEQIEQALAASSLAILLVSEYFVASEFIVRNELPPLLNRAEQGGIRLLCIAVSDSLHERLGIGKYQWLNDPKRPLNRLRQPDWRRELVDIARQIEELIMKAH